VLQPHFPSPRHALPLKLFEQSVQVPLVPQVVAAVPAEQNP
jgi:hypothetical protein